MTRLLFLLSLALLLPLDLLAHGSHGGGIMAGFTHPIFGIDHAVFILGLGIVSYLIDAAKWYLIFIAFLIAMIVGGVLGVDNEATFLIEKIIAASVVLAGLAILFYKNINRIIVMIAGVAFGFVHGYAHGAEMPDNTTLLEYVSGYALGALLVGVVGMVLAKLLLGKDNANRNIRFVAGVLTGCGIMIILG